MTTQPEVHEAIEEHTRDHFPDIPVIYDNQNIVGMTQGTVPFLRQKVTFLTNNQSELTDRCFRRNDGFILMEIYWRKGTGTAIRNTLQPRVHRAYSSQLIGAATMRNSRVVSSAGTDNWAILGIQIPFFFYEVH